MTAEEVVEMIARMHDRRERAYRTAGLFELAVTCQQIASDLRDGTAGPGTFKSIGSPARDLYVALDNGYFYAHGDLPKSEIPSLIIYLCEEIGVRNPFEEMRHASALLARIAGVFDETLQSLHNVS